MKKANQNVNKYPEITGFIWVLNMRVKNKLGRIIETDISGNYFKPFSGAKKYQYFSKVTDLSNALKNCGIKDGSTISFHHQLRNGDFVVNKTIEISIN